MAEHELEQQSQRERAFASEADKVQRLEDILAILNVSPLPQSTMHLIDYSCSIHPSDTLVEKERPCE